MESGTRTQINQVDNKLLEAQASMQTMIDEARNYTSNVETNSKSLITQVDNKFSVLVRKLCKNHKIV